MGNDVSVFEEGQLEKDFWSAHGPKDESWTQFMSRSFSGMTKILTQPKRMEYRPEDAESRSEDTNFRVELFTIPGCENIRSTSKDKKKRSRSRSNSAGSVEESPALAAALWQQGTHRPGGVPRPLVLYLHTNTRSLVDAKEVLPLCDALGASLLAFDLPGCGESEGKLTFQMAQDLDRVVQYAHNVLGFDEIVLWARGMATAIAVEYCVSFNAAERDRDKENMVKFVVLDSPFTSVRQMVIDGSKAIKCFGLSIPETVVLIGCKVVRGKVCSSLGSDPFDVNPLSLVEGSNKSLPPCHIFSALDDDYIPAAHGNEICKAWQQTEAPCEIEEFSARHFGERDTNLLMKIEDKVNECLTFDKEAEEAAALSSIDLKQAFLRPTSSTSSITMGRIPWAGVW